MGAQRNASPLHGLYPGPTTSQHSLGLSSCFSRVLGIVNPPNEAVGPNCTAWSPKGSLWVSLMLNTSLCQSSGGKDEGGISELFHENYFTAWLSLQELEHTSLLCSARGPWEARVGCRVRVAVGENIKPPPRGSKPGSPIRSFD